MNKVAAIGGSAAPFPSSLSPNMTLTLMLASYFFTACDRRTKFDHRTYSNSNNFRRVTTEDLPDKLLFSAYTGYFLQISSDGHVNGTRKEKNPYSVLEFLSVAFGLVSIKGKESNRYLCMDHKGKLYGSLNHTTDCIFMEKMLENYYNTYTSCKYSKKNRKWFVALNKRGRPRKGSRSKKKQKFSQFLVLHLDVDDVQYKRRNFFGKSTQLGISSFTNKWRNTQASHLMRVWTRAQPPVNQPYSKTNVHHPNNRDPRRG